jgi:hypothetical protein
VFPVNANLFMPFPYFLLLTSPLHPTSLLDALDYVFKR